MRKVFNCFVILTFMRNVFNCYVFKTILNDNIRVVKLLQAIFSFMRKVFNCFVFKTLHKDNISAENFGRPFSLLKTLLTVHTNQILKCSVV